MQVITSRNLQIKSRTFPVKFSPESCSSCRVWVRFRFKEIVGTALEGGRIGGTAAEKISLLDSDDDRLVAAVEVATFVAWGQRSNSVGPSR